MNLNENEEEQLVIEEKNVRFEEKDNDADPLNENVDSSYEKQFSKDALMIQTLFSITFNTLFAYFFNFFAKHEYFDQDDEADETNCHDLRQWAIIFSWICTSLAAIRLLLNMPLIFLDPEEENPICILGVFRCTFWVEILVTSVFWLAFAMIYLENEPCGALRTVTFVYLLVCVVIVLIFVVISAFIFFCKGEKFGKTVCEYFEIMYFFEQKKS